MCAQTTTTKETIMKMPDILQGEARTRFLQGIAFGAVAAITIGFFWGGWVTGGTAKTMSVTAESSGRMSVLVPICVAQFTAADGAVVKFKAASSYSKDNVISEYVKTVAATNMDYTFARACAAGVEAELSKTAAKS
jgi:Flp pilus assembly protein protease CpaA